MSRARIRALSHDQILTVVRRADSSAPTPTPPPARSGCGCPRCVINALAKLHRELAAGVHADLRPRWPT